LQPERFTHPSNPAFEDCTWREVQHGRIPLWSPTDRKTVDSITTELIEYETSNALFIAQVGSNTITAGTVVDRHALDAETQGNTNHSSRGRGRGHGRTRGRGSGRGCGNGRKPYERSVGKCFYCTKEGHRASDCSLKQKADKLKKETYDGWKGQKTISGKLRRKRQYRLQLD